ncbi:MAG TPA: protein kinase, partial [Thermoanaerobaculia bacterium]|nr:protein kinase [Thermoanaerobaculia bacterium]
MTSRTDGRWAQIDALFDAALDLPREERAAFVEARCGDDEELRAELAAMLAAHERHEGILDAPASPWAERALAETTLAELSSTGSTADTPSIGGEVQPARRQIGPYRLLRHIGRGGMGEVWQAYDERLDRFIALKFLPEDLAGHEEAKARFVDEARAASRLDHPAICTVHDVGDDGDGNLYIAMAFYEGRTVADRVTDGPLPVAEALDVAARTAEGLAHAHEQGIVHRDVKPSNLMLTDRGELKILDFGIAKLSVGATAVTRSGMQVGTLSYMSPEQARGQTVDGRSDLWSLGVVLYEMLTGERPFQRASAYGTVEAILKGEPTPLAELRPDAPAAVEGVLRRALGKQPGERFTSGAEMASALRAVRLPENEEPETEAERVLRSAAHPLPAPLTSFVGRDPEIDQITGLLSHARLVTLTGPAGSGKTRLAVETARRVADRFRHGVRFVPLSTVEEADLVPSAIARTLGITIALPRPPVSLLVEMLADSEMLLVLDNFEHVVAAATAVGELLAACPGVRVLATSQVVLRMSGEHTYPVPTLELPSPSAKTAEALTSKPSSALFIERARAVRPDLSLAPDDARAIAELCIRLEGLPLALELAASRVQLFAPRELLPRLGSRLDLAAADHRDRSQRHRTLRAALDWSHGLLDEAERALFRRLSVCFGSFSLSMAEQLAAIEGGLATDVLSALAALADHSLLRREDGQGDGEPRFGMLETIREYGREQLDEVGEMEAARRAHAHAALALAERAAAGLTGPEQARWFDLLEADRANLRAALAWAEEVEDAEVALRLAGSLWRFWLMRGLVSDARTRLERILAMPGAEARTALRARVVDALGTVCHNLGDNATAHRVLEESLSIYRELEDQRGIVIEINNLAWVACEESDYATATELAEEGLVLSRRRGTDRGAALSFMILGWVANYRGRYREARRHHEACLAVRETTGDQRGIVFELTSLAWAEQYHGAHTRALALLSRAEALLKPIDDLILQAFVVFVRVRVLLDRDMLDRADGLVSGNRELWREVGNRALGAWRATSEGTVARRLGEHERAAAALDEGVDRWRGIGSDWGVAIARFEQALLARDLEDLDTARDRMRLSLRLRHGIGEDRGEAESLEGLVVVGALDGVAAVRALAAAAVIRERIEAPA